MAEALEVRELRVCIGARAIVEGVSFRARAGEVLAVLGPNGAGKSTLLRALLGLVPYQGEVRIAGRTGIPTEELAKTASLVPAQSQLSAALRVREVVALGRYSHRTSRTVDEARIARALAETDLAALAERAYSELSTGEQKRTLLARALCTDASLLLLDEPTASLDIEHALRLFVLLRALAAEGRAVVMVLHQVEHALAFADQALLLKQGRPLAWGPTADVITRANVRALYGVEMVEHAAPGFRLP
jgi:iron complex transport system ATP-binding protein